MTNKDPKEIIEEMSGVDKINYLINLFNYLINNLKSTNNIEVLKKSNNCINCLKNLKNLNMTLKDKKNSYDELLKLINLEPYFVNNMNGSEKSIKWNDVYCALSRDITNNEKKFIEDIIKEKYIIEEKNIINTNTLILLLKGFKKKIKDCENEKKIRLDNLDIVLKINECKYHTLFYKDSCSPLFLLEELLDKIDENKTIQKIFRNKLSNINKYILNIFQCKESIIKNYQPYVQSNIDFIEITILDQNNDKIITLNDESFMKFQNVIKEIDKEVNIMAGYEISDTKEDKIKDLIINIVISIIIFILLVSMSFFYIKKFKSDNKFKNEEDNKFKIQ